MCVCVCVRIGVYQSMGAPAGSARTEATVFLLSSMKRLVWCFLPDDPESVRFAGSGVETRNDKWLESYEKRNKGYLRTVNYSHGSRRYHNIE